MLFMFYLKFVNEQTVIELYAENDSCGTQNETCNNLLCHNNLNCSG